jgi:hypothetical protein
MASALSIVRKKFPRVNRVVDAKKSIIVAVSRDDSHQGKLKDHSHCALARACQKRFNLDGTLISLGSAYLVSGRTATRYKVPDSTAREIVSFDRKAGFTPGEYVLMSPAPTNRLGARKKRQNPNGGSHKRTGGDLSKRFQHQTQGVRPVLGR